MLTIGNDALRLVVNPTRGGRIETITSLHNNRQWLYFDERRFLASDLSSMDYDESWCGSFEEIFPNDAPCEFEGRSLRDHGELWNAAWDIAEQSSMSVDMQLVCTTVPALVRKRIHLDTTKPRISVEYAITNNSDESFSYLFKLHPALNIQHGGKIVLSGGIVIPVSREFSTMVGMASPWSWPLVDDRNGEQLDLSVIPSRDSSLREFVYVKDLPSGICGLRDISTGEEFRMTFSIADFPYCWLFMAYGGWRDHYTLVLEPCTNIPKDLAEAKRNKSCAVLKPRETRHFSVAIEIG